ncbi:hypothetical protein [Streptomyces griseus]|uniref:hypothetical protein n=1 Tax=Streptomyces griseus TaxID=1911 RepID=UPI0037B8EB1F
MNRDYGYSLHREIVDVLLDENPEISDNEIRSAGGGVVALVLTVEKPRNMRLYRLVKELKFQARHSAAQVVAVTMPAESGPAWEVLSLSFLRELAEDAVAFKDQRRLQAALKPRVR